MKPNNAIVLILFLVIIFAVLFAWFLHRTCRRLVSAEVHEMLYQQDLEAQRSAIGKGELPT
jgi:cell division protein FtsL